MKVGLLFSGGKDSTYAGWIVQHQAWEVSCLLTFLPESENSMMFHYPNVKWTRLQAQAQGIPQENADIELNHELESLESSLKSVQEKYRIIGVVSGALASDYQKTRIDRTCDILGLKSYSPLWHKRPVIFAKDLRQSGFDIVLTRVAANGLDASWLGHVLTAADWDNLGILSQKYGFNLMGEGGEYESFVVDAPHFHKRIEISKGHVDSIGDSKTYIIDDASLHEKKC